MKKQGLQRPFTQTEFDAYFNSLPLEVRCIITSLLRQIPMQHEIYKQVKNRFPVYWNELGEFDPYFHNRYYVINKLKRFKRWVIGLFLKRENLWIIREPSNSNLWKAMIDNYRHHHPYRTPGYNDLTGKDGISRVSISSLLNKYIKNED